MRFKNSTALLSVSFAALTSTSALADITADDLWNSYQTIAETIGGELTATTTRDGNSVTFTDAKLNFTIETPEETFSIALLYPTLSYTNNTDGTVSMDMGGDHVYTLMATGPNPETDHLSVEVLANYDNAALIASGTPDDIVFAYAMDGFTFELQNITSAEDLGFDASKVAVTGSANDVHGSTRLQMGDLITISDQSKISSLGFETQAFDTMAAKTLHSGTYNTMTNNYTVALPTGGMAITNLAAALKQGLALSATSSTVSSTSTTSVDLDGETVVSEKTTFGTSSGSVSANADAIQMSGRGSDVSIENAADHELPFDLSAKVATVDMDIRMPISASDAPQDFTVAFNLGGLTVGEELWSLFDPAAVLPRDPATIDVNLTGQTTVFQDFMNFAKMMELSNDDVPLELNALTVKNFLISAAGASLSGTGDFAFNNDDLTSFDGMPAPSGSAELQIAGANGLIDKLIQMGLIAESDAMGARMMMGMLAVPGDGDDTLKSKLEITEDGQILANGQRIK
ncbi:hypothetical protein A9Q94_15350 [Rhodobacterales bacterium 56_14_T64]|mgnify:CR=1 FL=1|nr:hypothetical protein A9Q94_15350 [Rhodobacterales bacterium 56_14_T64]